MRDGKYYPPSAKSDYWPQGLLDGSWALSHQKSLPHPHPAPPLREGCRGIRYTIASKTTRRLLVMDLVILNHVQVILSPLSWHASLQSYTPR
ncbi:hypothetical protein TNCV_869811 [Trichonephila clavipes]|nr:hypothetical protein TNCV_869811 [Trichonephila clavipes]